MSCRGRLVFLLVASLSLGTPARALCAPRAVDIWPPAGPVPPNTAFLIEGYGLDRALVESMQSCELMLVSESEQLCLVLQDRSVGEVGVTQALLRPERPLLPGVAYRILASDGGSRVEQWAQAGRLGSGLSSATWVVDLPHDETPPTWRKQPRVMKAEVTPYGCGPAIGATVRVVVDDEDPVLVHTVVESDGSDPRSFLLQPYEGEIHVGHGMCSGAFRLNPGEGYRATLSLVDAAGNASESTSRQVEFTIPIRK